MANMGIQEGLADSVQDRRKWIFVKDVIKKGIKRAFQTATPTRKALYEDMKLWKAEQMKSKKLDQEQIISTDLQEELVKACDREGIQFAVAPIDEEKFRLFFYAKDTKQVDRVLKETYKALEAKKEREGDCKPYQERYEEAKQIRDEQREKHIEKDEKLKIKDRGIDRS